MASIRNFIRKLSPFFSKISREKRDEDVQSRSNNWENVLMEIQKILVWDDPFHSCICVISVNIVFWLIIYLDFKFYGIIFSALFILIIGQLWNEYNSQSITGSKPQCESPASDVTKTSETGGVSPSKMKAVVEKSHTVISNIFLKTRLFRQTQPGRFCICTCVCFLYLGLIGNLMSGATILYILLMFIMIVPGVLIHFLPPQVISNISHLIYSSRKVSESSESEFDELNPYLPETNTEALELLKLAANVPPPRDEDEESNDLLLEKISGRTSDETESISSKLSFYPESPTMPSPENSMDFLELDLPSGDKYQFNENESSDINFQSKHLEGDSSSEEEFVKGLNLSEIETKKSSKQEPKQASVLNAENLISLGSNLLATALNKKTLTRESSSDTDSFEMISDEEI